MDVHGGKESAATTRGFFFVFSFVLLLLQRTHKKNRRGLDWNNWVHNVAIDNLETDRQTNSTTRRDTTRSRKEDLFRCVAVCTVLWTFEIWYPTQTNRINTQTDRLFRRMTDGQVTRDGQTRTREIVRRQMIVSGFQTQGDVVAVKTYRQHDRANNAVGNDDDDVDNSKSNDDSTMGLSDTSFIGRTRLQRRRS